jgi:hypothetical protein
LANAVDSVNCLRLGHRVPMRFDDVDVVRRCEIESKGVPRVRTLAELNIGCD